MRYSNENKLKANDFLSEADTIRDTEKYDFILEMVKRLLLMRIESRGLSIIFFEQEVIFMNESNASAFLEQERLGTLMRKYAIPCIISLLVAALYNIVDQIFIANAAYLGLYSMPVSDILTFFISAAAIACTYRTLSNDFSEGSENEKQNYHNQQRIRQRSFEN